MSPYYQCGSEDGLAEPRFDEVETAVTFYYLSYLRAINAHDIEEMDFVTDSYCQRIQDRVYSDANQQYEWEILGSSAQISVYKMRDEHTLVCNAQTVAMAPDPESLNPLTVNNCQTYLLIWDRGAWRVDNSAFITEEEFYNDQFGDVLT